MWQKIITIFVFCLILISEVQADIAVIVNPKNAAVWDNEKIKNQIKDIFLNVKDKFPDGTSAKPVDQNEGRQIRRDFYSKIAGKDDAAMNVYWSNLIFTGNGRPPKAVGDDANVKKHVSENANSIGYISSELVDATVKSIYTVK